MSMIEQLIILDILIKHPNYSLNKLENLIRTRNTQEFTAQEINALEFFFESKEWTKR